MVVPNPSDEASELTTSAYIGRMILQASANLPLLRRDAMLRALDEESEHLAAIDLASAERAMAALNDIRDRLGRAIDDARLAGLVSAAIVGAADALGPIDE